MLRRRASQLCVRTRRLPEGVDSRPESPPIQRVDLVAFYGATGNVAVTANHAMSSESIADHLFAITGRQWAVVELRMWRTRSCRCRMATAGSGSAGSVDAGPRVPRRGDCLPSGNLHHEEGPLPPTGRQYGRRLQARFPDALGKARLRKTLGRLGRNQRGCRAEMVVAKPAVHSRSSRRTCAVS